MVRYSDFVQRCKQDVGQTFDLLPTLANFEESLGLDDRTRVQYCVEFGIEHVFQHLDFFDVQSKGSTVLGSRHIGRITQTLNQPTCGCKLYYQDWLIRLSCQGCKAERALIKQADEYAVVKASPKEAVPCEQCEHPIKCIDGCKRAER